MTAASIIAFAIILAALAAGYLWHEIRIARLAQLRAERRAQIYALPMMEALAVLMAEQLLPEVEAHLQEQR